MTLRIPPPCCGFRSLPASLASCSVAKVPRLRWGYLLGFSASTHCSMSTKYAAFFSMLLFYCRVAGCPTHSRTLRMSGRSTSAKLSAGPGHLNEKA